MTCFVSAQWAVAGLCGVPGVFVRALVVRMVSARAAGSVTTQPPCMAARIAGTRCMTV